jgi:hypothetical protein
VDAGDLDGDGDIDIVYAGYGEGRFKWCKNNGLGMAWGTPVNLGSSGATWARLVKIADLDNDNDSDIIGLVFANSGFAQITWFKNNGTGTFTATTIAGLDGNNAFDFVIADLNGDGYKDIVASYYNSNAVYWYRNNGDGTFGDRTLIINSFTKAISLLANDFDQDGDNDVIAVSSEQNIILYFKNNGSGVFDAPANINTTLTYDFTVSSGTDYMVTDDFNNDGRPDFAAVGSSSTAVKWFKNKLVLPLQSTSSGNFSLSCSNSNNGAIYIQIKDGTPPYAITWSQSGISGDTITNLSQGIYYCTITDADMTTIKDTFIITAPLPLSAQVFTTLAYPNNGSISLVVSDGTAPYSYIWDTGATTEAITDIPAGFYFCTITDNNGCTQVIYEIVNTLPPIVVALDQTKTYPIFCAGDSTGALAVLVAGGIAPYAAAWSNGDTGLLIQNLPAGTYFCTVTDALGGTGTASLTLSDPTFIFAAFSVTNATDGLSNGAITNIVVTGGNGNPYSFLWNNNATTASITGLEAGTYTCTISDSLGCTTIETYVVDNLVATGEALIDTPKMLLVPNPAHQYCTIIFDQQQVITEVKVYDSKGNVIFQKSSTNTPVTQIPTEYLPAGLYNVETLSSEGKIYLKKLIIHH